MNSIVKEQRNKNGIKGLNYASAEVIYEDFKRLTEYYERRSGCEDLGADLILFICELVNSGKAISRRYVAVAVKNEYIRLSKRRTEQMHREGLLDDSISSAERDIDTSLDVRKALMSLTTKQRKSLVLHHVNGYSFDELAKRHGTTRQAEYKTERRAVEALKAAL